MKLPASNPFLEALHAAGPDPQHAEALQLYGRFVGSWNLELSDYFADGAIDQSEGEWHFGWVLQGRAIQDVWIAPPGPRRNQGPPAGYPLRYGTTIRMYQPQTQTWRINWIDPALGFWVTQVGRADDGCIVQLGQTVEGTPMRWSFRDITPRSFRWLGEVSDDDGASWHLQLEMRARRA
ncbi:MAG: hypothetical protein P4L83_11840 [Nevskia sp.]|nr:hypothetical protein [Nevskia sp.]